ncbi:MAG: CPBP family intramembrane metalloprotease [Verrucomicrobiaceae bacterium]|nr:CPBP family intramembrane metalloprotease [Verrucomicrobiaceae bacterium]
MLDAATIGVLRDVVTLVLLALGIGLFVYRGIRRALPEVNWNYQGNVLARLYGPHDAVMAMLLLSPYIGGLLLYSPAETAGPASSGASAAAGGSAQVGAVLSQIVFSLGSTAALLVWLRPLRGLDVGDLFGIRVLPIGKVIGFALGAIAPTFLIVVVVNLGAVELLRSVWPDISPQQVVKAFETSGSVPLRLLMGFAAVIAAPLTEELLFRGLLYGVCKRFTDSWFAALVTSLLFASVHLHVGSFIPLFALALILVAVYEITGSLLVPIVMHALFNGLMLIAMLLGAK